MLIILLSSCNGGQRKVIAHNSKSDTTSRAPVRRDTTSIDIHDPYETGKDTLLLNAVMERIFTLPEVEAINKLISKTSKGSHGVSIMVHDEFEGDSSYYHFMVGDNSHEARFVSSFNFLLEKKTGQLKAYYPLLDSIMSLQDWRQIRK